MKNLSTELIINIITNIHSASDLKNFCQLNKYSNDICKYKLPYIIKQLIKVNKYDLLYDAAINNYLIIVKL